MTKIRLFIPLTVTGLLLVLLLPVGLWIASGRVLWLLLLPFLLLLMGFSTLQVALRGSRGSLPAYLRGQFKPQPKHLQGDISITGGVQVPYASRVTLDLERPLAEVSERYLSFSIDTSQVVGGKWWNPQADRVEWSSGTVPAPVFDFTRPKLNLLTEALAPAYLRIGGSEADKVYYDLEAGPGAHPSVPEGYESVFNRGQWDAIHAFASRNDLNVVCTLNAGPAARDRAGRWQGDNAAEFLAYTARQGYPVAVWELGNEVNISFAVHGLSAQVSVEQYAQDLEAVRRLVGRYTPSARLAGQGSAYWPVLGEPFGAVFGFLPGYLKQAGHLVDLITWHYYPQQSRRGPVASRRAHPSRLLDPNNLDEAGHWARKINRWRDEYAPGRPVWLGETGNAQFGGEPGLSDVYLGGLWWLDQLGLLACQGHQVVVRQSLTGMDYGLLDEDTLEPRSDYWNSLLWKRLMGRRVCAAQATGDGMDRLRVYAHAPSSGDAASVTILAINLDPQRDAILSFPQFEGRAHERYALTAPEVLGRTVLLNGVQLGLVDGRTLPEIRAQCQQGAGLPTVTIHPLSYTFVVFR